MTLANLLRTFRANVNYKARKRDWTFSRMALATGCRAFKSSDEIRLWLFIVIMAHLFA